MTARGVLYVHSATSAVTPHIEWAVAGVLGMAVRIDWAPQPASSGSVRAEASWVGEPGCGGRIASALLGWPVRFEVTEDATPGCDGERYAFTPTLGLFHAMTSASGDLVVPENRRCGIRALRRVDQRPGRVHRPAEGEQEQRRPAQAVDQFE